MSNGTNGLRFDVYERVHLPDDVAGIDELEEIELVPRIQVIDRGEQAILKGQLLLSGVYRGQEGAPGPYALEHWIPVEISLPMNRVTRLDDISIEIDNFDVDLLSARTLNITGVLSLRGISVDPVEEQQTEQWEESFTAVHQRELYEPNELENEEQLEQQALYANSADEAAEPAVEIREEAEPATEEVYISAVDQPDEAEEQEAIQHAEALQQAEASREQAELSWLEWNAQQEANQAAIEQQQASQQTYQHHQEAPPTYQQQQGSSPFASLYQPYQQPSYASRPIQQQAEWEETIAETQAIEAQAAEPESSDEPYRPEEASEIEEPAISLQEQEPLEEREPSLSAEVIAIEPEPELEAKKPQEVQIAFQSKPSGGSEEASNELGFRTLLQSSRREQAARHAAEEIANVKAAEAEKAESTEDEIEWKRLFLSKQSEDNEFRKIRMCIVQRDETLEQIATRYKMNPREILIHNGLHESAVAEGQLLYIP
ncbi:LysM peptidoglycan-binding domain-containing protein [Paenibacillus nanensis]|uniref:LysM peptidoglycan-binding domain-containing protein n=1 Tax=Paenibacillus nanensis TaxID=393251 RepID=A0A3A1UQK0_9BACL|nr:LysM peptidoglycan-binding domain-containing protein [Paenibacillus nanensis]RIX50535.1 LysM peptidoglycan-binding domain-containing protein [Paenibacillus nanensis]